MNPEISALQIAAKLNLSPRGVEKQVDKLKQQGRLKRIGPDISRELMHWESQANTVQNYIDGQNLIHNQERGYMILVFARDQKKRNNVTVPFTYLGPVDMVSYESDRPIKMVWRLRHLMPVEMFEDSRRGG